MEAPAAICNYGSSGSSNSSLDGSSNRKLTRLTSSLCDTGPTGGVNDITHTQDHSHEDDGDDDDVLINPGNERGYEEFFGGTMVCPTCNGKGRISRGR